MNDRTKLIDGAHANVVRGLADTIKDVQNNAPQHAILQQTTTTTGGR